MDPEEQQRIDEEARRAAAAQMASLDDVGGQTREALAPVTGPAPHRVDLGEQPELDRISAPAASEAPAELPTRDHLGNEDLSSGSVFGPDYDQMPAEEPAPPTPSAAAALDQPWGAAGNAETFGTAADADPVPPGVMDEPEAVHNPTEEGAEASAALDVSSPQMRALDTEEARGEVPRLDAGLPTEEEIGSAHTADDFRRPFHALGAMFLGAGGRSVPAFEERAAPLEQERRAGLRQALAAKGATRAAEATQAATSMRQRIQDALAERRVAAAEAMVPARIAATEAGTERTRAQTQSILSEDEVARLEREGSEDPASPESRSARLGFQTGIGRLPPQMAERIIAESGLDAAHVDQASARDLAVANEMIRRVSVGARGGGGTSRTGGASSGREAIIAEYMRLLPGTGPDGHMTREEAEQHAAAMRAAPAGSRTEIGLPLAEGDTAGERAQLRRTERGIAILPGVYADADIITSGVAQRDLHDRIMEGTQHLGALDRLEEIGAEYGRTGSLDPRAEADLVGARSGLMAMVASLENSGVIGPGDLPRIQAAVPNPSDFTQANLGTLSRRLTAFRNEIDRAARIQLRGAGVTEDGLDAAIRFMHGGGAAPLTPVTPAAARPRGAAARTSTPSDARVRVRRRSDGRAGSVTPAFLAAHADEYEELR